VIRTPSQTVGPFFGFALPFPTDADAAPPGSPGAIRIEGQLLDGAGEPVPDGLLEAWQADQFVRCRTDAEGAFHFTLRKPDSEGDEAPHLEVAIFARGLLRHLMTRIYFSDEEAANTSDPVLRQVETARRQTLIARSDGGALHFDVRLQGKDETVFFSI
jgi:protocatechuate 3,4-dioxygenase, alpha subunit